MQRRSFLNSLLAAASWPFAAFPQGKNTPTLGVLVVEAPGSERFWRLFREAMGKIGYAEGEGVRYEFRSSPDATRLAEMAAELVRLKVDLIVTWFTPSARAAKQATRQIPIVMAFVGNPVETGLVDSLARPGGNITGMSTVGSELSAKCVELVREILPSARRIAALANAPDPFSGPFLEQVSRAGAATNMMVERVMIERPEGLEPAFLAMEKQKPDALVVQGSLPTKRIAELAIAHRLPTAAPVRGFVEEGGLMSYGIDEADTYHRAAGFVEKILKGAEPADLPVEQASRYELVINLKTAKILGLSLPQSLLQRANEVIE